MASNSQVAHAWANKTGKQCNGPSVYYREETIYSYGSHFPMAEHRTLPNGKEVVLITTRAYSSSTARHLSYVWSATTHLNQIHCDDVLADTKEQHKKNYLYMLKSRAHVLDLATRARVRKESHLIHANRKRIELNEYSKLFKLGYHEIKPLAELDLKAELSKLKAIDKKAYLKQKREQAKRESEREKRAIVTLEKWQKGENVTCPYFPGRGDFVRIKGDTIQTSKGARVPLDRALKLFKIMKNCAETSKGWKPSDCRIGDFRVDYIHSDGELTVACHTIPLENAITAVRIAGIEL